MTRPCERSLHFGGTLGSFQGWTAEPLHRTQLKSKHRHGSCRRRAKLASTADVFVYSHIEILAGSCERNFPASIAADQHLRSI